jgi:CRISPR-associated protein Cas1
MKRSFYLFTSGTLTRHENSLLLETQEGEKKYIPVETVGEIHVFGELQINKRALEFLAQHNIILHFFNFYDYYVGSFYPREHLNSGYMILKQAQHYLDLEKRLFLAYKFFEGAAKNMIKVLKYYEKRGKPVGEALNSIENLLKSAQGMTDINELMAIEGNIRQVYYNSFDAILQDEEFSFTSRTRKPPQNQLNALISFGNSLLYSVCLTEIYQTHLDPRIGYLHTTNFRRFTLNLDVAEIFKPILVDRVIFTLVGKGMIKSGDFSRKAGGLLLSQKAMRTFVEQWENKLNSTVSLKSLGRPFSYRRLIRIELYKLEKHLMEEKVYEPLVAEW